ncbi:hypothetical protein [Kitasatospora sp. NPDC088548]|uniref:hypothetical protein n=1 Tax=Kitasatospora sp. NPDC088548 TaxID=3364075 RepID=UPI00380B63F7
MSLSRTGPPAGDPAPPAAPRRRFPRLRGSGGPVAAVAPPTAPAAAPSAPAASPAVRSVLRPVGPHFVIAPATAGEDELSAAVGALRPVPDSLVVVAAAPDSAPVLRDRMADLGVIARSRGAGTLVLAASGLAALAPNGRRPAEVVADRAGVPVIAPDGLVEITPDGNLKVAAPDGSAETATWWLCAPGTAPRRLRETVGGGAGHAAPATLPAPPPTPEPAPHPQHPAAVRVARLPAGYWLTHLSAQPGGPFPALGLLAAPPGALVLLVGTPGQPVLLPEDLAETVRTLPVGGAALLLSAPWAAPDELSALTGTLAARLGRPVQAAVGLPVHGPGGPTSRTVDARGHAGWEPYLLRLTASAGRPTVPSAWRNGGASWQPAGPALFQAFPYWSLEAVPAGLWLRPDPPHLCAPRFRRADPGRPLLIVGERDRPVGAEVWEELSSLLDRLPAAGAQNFGLLAHGILEPGSERTARFIARLHGLEWLGSDQPGDAAAGAEAVSYGLGPVPGPAPAPVSARPALAAEPDPLTAPRPVITTGRVAPLGAASEPPAAELTAGQSPTAEFPTAEFPTAEFPTEEFATAGFPASQVPPAEFPTAVPEPPAPTRTSSGPLVSTGGTGDAPRGGPEAPGPAGAPGIPDIPRVATSSSGDAPGAVPQPPGPDRPAASATAGTGGADEPATGLRTPAGTEPPTTATPEAEPAPLPFPPPDPLPRTGTGTEPVPGPAPGPDPGPEPGPGEPEPSAPGPDPEPLAVHVFRAFRAEEFTVPVAVSSPADREAVRALLGSHYQRCVGRVEEAATRLPGLRSTTKDDIKADLAAVLLHHADTGVPVSRTELAAEARAGGTGPHLAFLNCLGSGLRRLPSHQGVVLLGAHVEQVADLLAAYPVGRELLEPAPLAGLTSPAVELGPVTVEFAVLSVTARRTSAFDSAGEEPQAVFAPGTGFIVVDVEAADEEAGRPARVLLREAGGALTGDPAERNAGARGRVRAWLTRRDRTAPADRRQVRRPERFRLTPGIGLPPAEPTEPPEPAEPDSPAEPTEPN